ncbi:MAG: hypothetical protein AAGH40_10945 [Verrucomicrobiota bacterium]
MDKFLKELREQRDRIKAHLDWLEQKIERLENQEGSDPSSNDAPLVEAPIPSEEKTTKSTETLDRPEPPIETGERQEKAPVFVPTAYASSTGSDIKKLQIGCSVIFVLATALFIFLLFGLPKLLEKDEESPSTEVEAFEGGSELKDKTY